MKINERAQEQLELLWILSEEKPSESVASHGQPEDYQELVEAGLVILDGERVALSAAGKHEAAMAIRRHRLAERLFVDVLATDASLIDEKACTLEHALFDGVDETICTLLGHPVVCPHGKPIPPGRCCEQGRASLSPIIAPLRDIKRGQAGKIAYLQMADSQRLHKLMAMGILPGVAIQVKETYPSVVFEAGYSQFAVDDEIAGDIFVRLAG